MDILLSVVDCWQTRDRKTVGCIWIFIMKQKADESIHKYKDTVVKNGYSQTLLIMINFFFFTKDEYSFILNGITLWMWKMSYFVEILCHVSLIKNTYGWFFHKDDKSWREQFFISFFAGMKHAGGVLLTRQFFSSLLQGRWIREHSMYISHEWVFFLSCNRLM